MKRFASRSISDRFDQFGGDDESSEDSPNGKSGAPNDDNDNDGNDERNVDASAVVEDDMNLLARQLT